MHYKVAEDYRYMQTYKQEYLSTKNYIKNHKNYQTFDQDNFKI